MEEEDCQMCGTKYLPGARFCRKCGHKRGAVGAAVPAGSSAVPAYAAGPPVTMMAPATSVPVTAPAPVTTYTRAPVTAPAVAQVAVRPQVQLVEKIVEIPQAGGDSK